MVPTKILIWVMPPARIAGTASIQKRRTSASRRGMRNAGRKPARSMATQTSTSCATPPAMVAMATQMVASTGVCTNQKANGIRALMVTRFSNTGAKAAAKNRPSVLRMAP